MADTCDTCGAILEFVLDTSDENHDFERQPGDKVEAWICPKCIIFYTIHFTPKVLTLADWIAKYPKLKKTSRALWMAIRMEFEEQKPPMTVRQMFYRMSSTGVVDKTENGYRQVQYALTAMRRAGAIPFEWLADNTRWVRRPRTYDNLNDAMQQMQKFYRRALWANQPEYIEIWLEKDALAGVLYDVTEEYDVPLYVTRGYPSLSYLHNAAEALQKITKPITIYHFGDYDASGQDAARSIQEGLHEFGARFKFIRKAVTLEQIGSLNLQTRPAKTSDPRAARHGAIAVELDAIPPAQLRQLVREVIESHIDQDALDFARQVEQQEKSVIDDWMSHFGSSTKTA